MKKIVILAHGPTVKSPATLPYRIVLCQRILDGKVFEYVVWRQIYDMEPLEDATSSYCSGHYFKVLYEAWICYRTTLNAFMEQYREGVYSERRSEWLIVTPKPDSD